MSLFGSCYQTVLLVLHKNVLLQFHLNISQGKDSSDDEGPNDVPDDDQYDTEDSFIDDAELVGISIQLIFFFSFLICVCHRADLIGAILLVELTLFLYLLR